MGNNYPSITDEMSAWIKRQKVFFVATAPLDAQGLINCSPKGGDTLRIIDSTTVAYLDLTGSGAETIAHLRENGRLVIMFCAFEGDAMIVRLHGHGDVILPNHPDFSMLASHFPPKPGIRSIIRLSLTRISDSCGMAVPFYTYSKDRTELDEWADDRGPAGLEAYHRKKNAKSVDGLPAIDFD